MNVVEIKSSEAGGLTAFFARHSDPTLPRIDHPYYRSGAHQGLCHIYHQYPEEFVAPCNFLWPRGGENRLWLIVHPAAIDEVVSLLDSDQGMEPSIRLGTLTIVTAVSHQIIDDVAMFQVRGSRSHAVLNTVLQTENPTWRALNNLRSPSCLEPGAVIGLDALDPRLSSPKFTPAANGKEVIADDSVLVKWPAEASLSRLFDAEVRSKVEPRSSNAINVAKSETAFPGSSLPPREDGKDLFPVLIIQSSSLPVCLGADIRRRPETSEGYNVLLPKAFAVPVWHALVMAGCRLGGLLDLHDHSFECSIPYFPFDAPDCDAYGECTEKTEAKLSEEHQKRPPAKRPDFSDLIAYKISPFVAKFPCLFGGEQPWVLRGAWVGRLVERLGPGTPSDFDAQCGQVFGELTSRDGSTFPWKRALLCVRLRMTGKGSLQHYSLLYGQLTEEVVKPKKHPALPDFEDLEAINEEDEFFSPSEAVEITPERKERLLGFTTSGRFSFYQGRPMAIGFVSLERFLSYSREHMWLRSPHCTHLRQCDVDLLF